MSSYDGSTNIRVAIEVTAATIEQEIEITKNISESLADAGFANVFVIAAQSIFSDTKAIDNYNKQQPTVSKDQPIVTVVSTKLH